MPSRIYVQGRLVSHVQGSRATCSVGVLVNKTWFLDWHLVAVNCGLAIYPSYPTDAQHATKSLCTNLNGSRGLVLGKRREPVGNHVSILILKLYVMLTGGMA